MSAAFADRVERLRAAARAAGLDAVMVTSDASIAYLTGFSSIQLERLFAVVVPVDGRPSLIVPSLEVDAISDVPDLFQRTVYDAASDPIDDVCSALGRARVVGVEDEHLVIGRAHRLEAAGCDLRSAGELTMTLRVAKDADEIERIRAAVVIVEGVIADTLAGLREGDDEVAVNAAVDYALRRAGATDAHSLVLFGGNAANPHGKPGARALRRGDVVCADVSAQIGGYWADLTRCASLGEPSEWALAAWRTVIDAQERAIAAARVGATGADVDRAQRTVVEAAPELGACLHGAGHAIGIDIHEPPFLTPRGVAPLVPGTVLTIEPGIYQSGVGGIRIEDVVVVTEDGPLVLSTLPRELVIPASAG